MNYKDEKTALEALAQKYKDLRTEISKVIIGQDEVLTNLLISILSNGHCLLVGVPGLAKTLMISSLSEVLDLSFSRVQFTPDLMPSDIIGTEILDENRRFKFLQGPVFANLILADEINRTPPKTQAALLEAMQEKAVTVAGMTYKLDKPFFVLATQNPIEQEGTYPLPEAQLDRFMLNIVLDYPSIEEEIAIVKATTAGAIVELKKVMLKEEILYFQKLISKIPVADNVFEYVVKLVNSTRPESDNSSEIVKNYISWGAGPRASQNLIIAAKTHAAIHGKFSPDKEDVVKIANAVLRHRLVKNYKAEAEGISIEDIISKII
jgi:MoxR-like ATPase